MYGAQNYNPLNFKVISLLSLLASIHLHTYTYIFIKLKIHKEHVFRNKHIEKEGDCFNVSSCRYFCFLAKQKPGHPECDILTNVFAILSAKNLSEATASLVMEIADDLLSLPDFEPSEAVLSLPVTGCVYTESADGM